MGVIGNYILATQNIRHPKLRKYIPPTYIAILKSTMVMDIRTKKSRQWWFVPEARARIRVIQADHHADMHKIRLHVVDEAATSARAPCSSVSATQLNHKYNFQIELISFQTDLHFAPTTLRS